MATRIVSWSDNVSPALSSAASIVSLDSTFSDTHTSLSQMSPTASGIPSADLGDKQTNIPDSSGGIMTARGGHVTPNDSFIRHDAYFFKDGNVTFLIDGMLYCVHRYFFSRDSVYFSTRFTKLGIRDHEALPSIILIGDVERNDFEALLSILYPTNFEAHELTYEQWKSVLHLSTRWGFASLRKLALNSIKPPTSHDQLVLARTYSVDHWVLPALTALCSRTLPLSLVEARQMNMEDVILVSTVREEIRGGELRVDAADISHHIEMAQAGNPIRPVVDKAYRDKPNGGTTEKQHRGTKEGDTYEGDLNSSSKEVPAESPEEDAGQGLEHPHASEGTPQGCPVKNVATTATQARGMRKLASPGAVAWPLAEAVLAENRGASARQEAEGEIMHRLKTQEAEVRTHAEARRAEAKAKLEAEARAKAESSAKVKAEAKAAKAKAEAEAAKAKAEVEAAKAKAEVEAAKAKAEAEAAKAMAEAEVAKAMAEAEAEYIVRQRAADKVARATASASASSPINLLVWGFGRSQFEHAQAASVAASAIISTEEPALPPKPANPWHSDPWYNWKNPDSSGNRRLSKIATSGVTSAVVPVEEPAPPKSSS